MGGPAFDCVANPLGAIRILFDEVAKAAGPSGNFSQGDVAVSNVFQKSLFEEGAIRNVPELNSAKLDLIPPNSLVRFRGMIQDMFNAEYYLGAYKEGDTWHTTKYQDMADIPLGSQSDTKVWDRRPLYCVPVPGESEWVRAAHRGEGQEASTSGQAESRGDGQGSKRQRGHEGDLEEEYPDQPGAASGMETDGEPPVESSEDAAAKRPREEGGGGGGPGPAVPAGFASNFPLGDSGLLPCLVKVYDNADAELKLNDVVEFVGILTHDPELSAASLAGGGDDPMAAGLPEDEPSTRLPGSKVPRLQCLLLRKLAGPYPRAGAQVPGLEAPEALRSLMAPLRKSLLDSLAKLLGGDSTAAEYLLLHILSRVHARVDPVAIGQLSLNLTGVGAGGAGLSSGDIRGLTAALGQLLPRAHALPLTLEALNSAPMAPHKDYDTNRLSSGLLQLAEGTHLTIDETALKAGQLSPVGMQNVQSLKQLLQSQKVEYDFQFYKMEMVADVAVLVLSQAKSRILPADVVLPVKAVAPGVALAASGEELDKWRAYLNCARHLEHSIEPDMQKVLEAELVAARQEDRSLTSETFHRWLTMGRLVSVSHGHTTLTREHWQAVQSLEAVCAARLRAC
eukprot:jgi/Mesen1/10897/ME000095S10230